MKNGLARLSASLAAISIPVVLLIACQASGPSEDASEAAVDEEAKSSWFTPPEKGGAQMWAENCSRCHYFRPAAERSDREWDIIAHHMRVRGNLTAREHRAIVRFLKSAN